MQSPSSFTREYRDWRLQCSHLCSHVGAEDAPEAGLSLLGQQQVCIWVRSNGILQAAQLPDFGKQHLPGVCGAFIPSCWAGREDSSGWDEICLNRWEWRSPTQLLNGQEQNESSLSPELRMLGLQWPHHGVRMQHCLLSPDIWRRAGCALLQRTGTKSPALGQDVNIDDFHRSS